MLRELERMQLYLDYNHMITQNIFITL